MPDKEIEVGKPAAIVKEKVVDRLWDVWLVFLLRGLFALALAFCAFFWPTQTIGLFTKLLGVYFIVDGLVNAYGAFKGGVKAPYLAPAVFSFIIGLVFLLWSGFTNKLFLVIVGIWAIVQGVGMLIAVWNSRSDDENRGHMASVGLLVLFAGVVFAFWPNSGIVAISWLIGTGSLIVGIVLLVLAAQLWKLKSRVSDLGQRTDE